MHKQIKISPGVYVIDYRKDTELKGIDNSQLKAQTKDIGLILDKISANQSKINQLVYSIQAMKQEEDWKTENVLLEAIQENYQLCLKFSREIKEWILDLEAVKYKAENDKIQELINVERIVAREGKIQEEFKGFLREFGVEKGADADSDKEQEEKIPIQVSPAQQKPKNQKEPKKQQDQGIYL